VDSTDDPLRTTRDLLDRRATVRLTSYAGQPTPARRAMTTGARVIGLRMFDRYAFVDLFTSDGIILLIDGLLPGGHPEIHGNAHRDM
jgi:hypothetical protein